MKKNKQLRREVKRLKKRVATLERQRDDVLRLGDPLRLQLPSDVALVAASPSAMPIAFVGLLYDWWTDDPLEGYDRTSTYTVPPCTIDIVVGHYRAVPHRFQAPACSGVVVRGCLMGGGTYERTLRPDVPIPAKEITPFPGSHPLSTELESPDNDFAQRILDDEQAARAHALTLLETCPDCEEITIRLRFVGFEDNWIDRGIQRHLRARGVEERTVTVGR